MTRASGGFSQSRFVVVVRYIPLPLSFLLLPPSHLQSVSQSDSVRVHRGSVAAVGDLHNRYLAAAGNFGLGRTLKSELGKAVAPGKATSR